MGFYVYVCWVDLISGLADIFCGMADICEILADLFLVVGWWIEWALLVSGYATGWSLGTEVWLIRVGYLSELAWAAGNGLLERGYAALIRT